MESLINEGMPQQPEKLKPKIYLPEVRAIIESDNNLDWGIDRLKEIEDEGNTLRHSQRIANMGYLLAKKLNFSKERSYDFFAACLLHDIGKTKTPPEILLKTKNKFTDEDRKIISTHSRDGKEMLKIRFGPRVYNPALLHHEHQERDYPPIAIEAREFDDNDEDVDNSRLLAMIDVFDRLAFGATNIETLPKENWKSTLMRQFRQPEDEEIIDFLLRQYETINKLGKNLKRAISE